MKKTTESNRPPIFDCSHIKEIDALIDPGMDTEENYLTELLDGNSIKYEKQPGNIESLELSSVIIEVLEADPEIGADLFCFLSGRNPSDIEFKFLESVIELAEDKIKQIIPFTIIKES